MSTYSRVFLVAYRRMYGDGFKAVAKDHRLTVSRDGFGGWRGDCRCGDQANGFAYRRGAEDWHAGHLGTMLIRAGVPKVSSWRDQLTTRRG